MLDQYPITTCISSLFSPDRLERMCSIYTNKDCLAISARTLSANIQLGLSQAELKAAVDAAILFVCYKSASPLQSEPHFTITIYVCLYILSL